VPVLAKVLLLYIPSIYIVNYGALGLLYTEYENRNLLFFSIIQGILMGVVRDILGLFGLHVVILAVTHVLLLMVIVRLTLVTALMARAFGLFLVTIGESYVAKLLISHLGISVEESLSQLWLHIGTGWLANSVAICVALAVVCVRFTGKMSQKETENRWHLQSQN